MIVQQQDIVEQRVKIEVLYNSLVKEQNKLFTQLQINQLLLRVSYTIHSWLHYLTGSFLM